MIDVYTSEIDYCATITVIPLAKIEELSQYKIDLITRVYTCREDYEQLQVEVISTGRVIWIIIKGNYKNWFTQHQINTAINRFLRIIEQIYG